MTAPLAPDALVPSAPVRPAPPTGWLKWTLRRRLGGAKTRAAMAAWTAEPEHAAGPDTRPLVGAPGSVNSR